MISNSSHMFLKQLDMCVKNLKIKSKKSKTFERKKK